MSSPRWKVLAGMTLGALVGFLLARLVFPERGQGAISRRPSSPEIALDLSQHELPTFGMGEEEFLDDNLPTIHADAIEVMGEGDRANISPVDAAAPDTLPDASQATPIDVHNQDAEKLLKEIIDEELADLGEPDRKVWFDVLRGMTEKEARDILQIWKLTGFPRDPSVTSEALSLPAQPPAPARTSASPHDAAIRAAVAINLAHLHVPGCRRLDARFARAGEDCPLDLSPGEIVPTHNPLHVAIRGEGFFMLTNGEETACTRCGCFDLNDDRELIQRHEGSNWKLQPSLRVPDEAVRLLIEEDGSVFFHTSNGKEAVSCGVIQLVACVNPQRLQRIGDSLLRVTGRSGPLQPLAPAHTHLQQGCLEQSNATADGEERVLESLERQAALLGRLP